MAIECNDTGCEKHPKTEPFCHQKECIKNIKPDLIPYCPFLLASAVSGSLCAMEKCGWFYKKEKQCGVLLIAIRLDEIRRAIEYK